MGGASGLKPAIVGKVEANMIVGKADRKFSHVGGLRRLHVVARRRVLVWAAVTGRRATR